MAAFVGRVDELASLGEIAAAAARDEVAAAVVVGDPGAGKSRLLAEVADRAGRLNLFRVTGYEPGRQVPLASAADLLRALAVFDPEGGGSGPEPVQIFESAYRALRSGGTALVLVDDLQWVDELSLALCHYLVRAAEGGGPPLALIAVARPSAEVTSFAR